MHLSTDRSDSLLARKLKNIRQQPNTIRGKMILWYASLADKPHTRFALMLGLSIFCGLHLFAFVWMLDYDTQVSLAVNLYFLKIDNAKNKRLISWNHVLLPMVLLTVYPMVLCPIIIWVIAADLKVSPN